jgi:membrane protease YdiL (CAAX protease family)
MSADPPGAPSLARAISACETLLGAIAVIGHNVYRVLPTEVPILVVLAITSMRWRERAWNWAALGFKRPNSWSRLLLIAVGAAALRVLLGDFVVGPITSQFWPAIRAPLGMDEIRGHLSVVLMYLPIVWIFAGFGEEIGYRGFLLEKLSHMLGGTRTADVLGVLGSSVLFGFGHYYKGPAGILDSGMAGVILGVAYLISGRNIWPCVLAHGFIDTLGLFTAYMGWDT